MRRVTTNLEALSPGDVLRLEKAQLAEQMAWEKVKEHLPGSPGHLPELWKKWRERVAELQRLSHDGPPPKKPD